LHTLYLSGRAAAAEWLDRNYESIGRKSTIDLEKEYL